MALHTKKQFAELCSKKTNELSVYVSRGKIILSGDYIDDSIEPNISFLNKCLRKSNSELEIEVEQSEIIEPVKKETTLQYSEPVRKSPRVGRVNNADDSLHQISIQNKLLTNEKLIEERDILREKRQRLQSVTIPKDLVVTAISYTFKNFYRNVKTDIENLITRYEKNFTPAQFADIRAAIVKEINHAQTNAVAESKKNIAEIILISSNKKEVGERE